MAYLRRGLVTNRGAIPSVHTKQQNFNQNISSDVAVLEEDHDHVQPQFVVKQVRKILKMADTTAQPNIVELECGHTVKSRSLYQGICRLCKH